MVNSYVKNMLGNEEKILFMTHPHWLLLLRNILIELFLVAVIVAAVTIATAFLPLAAFFYILLLVPLAGMVRDFLIWWNRQFIVTNRRVIQISGVFNKSVTDSSLEKVNDVKMDQSSLGRLFDYGNVEILTASELGVNLFERIGRPIRFKTAMLNAKEQLEHGAPAPAAGAPAGPADIPAMIAQLDQLRQKGVLTDAEFQQKKAELLSKL
ncbi:MAG: PH domain-containing protein [Chloroflexi bacterium]|nr:PH domain-containing protein [Chloroflexota bacterium]MCI0577121.1 PH domain-containing protein [Chloroflexota bacterium]MCI0646836.1 PH domain-containing protein [Chloroflexota bacterium]MCI0728815.1 PH domain-containing protein [Chloroflexota bacterium]